MSRSDCSTWDALFHHNDGDELSHFMPGKLNP